MHPNAKKSKSGSSRNQSSTIPEDYDEEFKDIMENARRKLEVPMRAAMPCKIQRHTYTATCRFEKDCKTKYACPHRYHEDYISAKGINSLSHYNLVHKFIPMSQALKNPDTKAAVENEWKNS